MKPLLFSILPRPPHPTRDGLAIRNYYLLRALSDEFRVRAFALRAPHLPPGEYPQRIDSEEVPQWGRRARRPLAAAGSLLWGEPYSALLYRSRRLALELARAQSREKPAWVVAHSYHVGSLALRLKSPAWIDFHNVDSQIWSRIGQLTSSPVTRWFAGLQTSLVRSLERRLATGAAGLSCVSGADARALLELTPSSRPLVVPNGVDLARYTFREQAPPEKLLFFVGDLSWPPNAEAIRWFWREVWPQVLLRHPDAVVEVLGRDPPASLTREPSVNFRLIGEGSDTRPFWRRAAAAIVPLRAAGGTRLKILEAAACGVPVVSTPVGAEGLGLDPGSEILLADDAEEFASAVSGLLSDTTRGASLARAARKRVEEDYDWRRIGQRLAAEILTRRTA